MKWLEALFALFRKPVNPPFVPASPPVTEPQKPSGARKAIGGVAGAAVIAAIVAFIGPWEGEENIAYQDLVKKWTICYGRTTDVNPGDTATSEQCKEWLSEEVIEFDKGIRKCITREMTINQEVSFVATSYNIGISAFCNSTAVKRFNAGDDEGACEALKMWNRAGGVVVKGLVNRRAAESALCKTK